MIVLGLGFGDEGKGLTTSYLASRKDNPIVVRFNGGHQAGHTVVYKEDRHVFSSFNAATLQGVPTYWTKYCTFFPTAYLNEYNAIKKIMKDNVPKYYVHALSPVTTLLDVFSNQLREKSLSHGSVGVGFGQTLQRHEDFFKIHVQDLFYETILRAKLKNIKDFYYNKLEFDFEKAVTQTFKTLEKILPTLHVINDDIDEFEILDQIHENVIFEGAQGILLDMDYGFFPNVTRSNTTSKNAMSFLKSDSIIANQDKVEVYYVTRTYQTRHGNGFMTNEELEFPVLKNAEHETNISHEYQGKFRKSILDIDLLNYALQCDNHHSYELNKNLVITCVDQTSENFKVTIKNKVQTINVKELASFLNKKFEKVFVSYGDDYSKIKELNI